MAAQAWGKDHQAEIGVARFGEAEAEFGDAGEAVFDKQAKVALACGVVVWRAIGEEIGGGGGAISILCSAGTVPVIRVGAGSHDGQSAGGSRALADGVGNFVPYDFYTDAGRTQVLAINGTITLPLSSGVAQTVNLYGQARGKVGLPAGEYTDTVSVELSF